MKHLTCQGTRSPGTLHRTPSTVVGEGGGPAWTALSLCVEGPCRLSSLPDASRKPPVYYQPSPEDRSQQLTADGE
ncbi:hypothetical protein NHX12_006601 [Muraenolepis orangiensis]|uniref:Uncharacterized protein n=1 Tax=Muraenolepis orangiensis TaxID=630683 RepID=A0A9Q0DSW1_9TELE|nr:hypothetical protein NHX12_006601 [Muraenolepis orangiensis]